MQRHTNEQRARQWFDIQLGKAKPPYYPEGHTGGLWGDRHGLYSFGTWFTVAEVKRDSRGVRVILINGMRGDLGTARHQAIVRRMAEASGKPWLSVPFVSLRQASINPATIKLIDKTADTFWDEELVEFEQPAGTQLVQPNRLIAHTGIWVDKDGAELLQEPRGAVGWHWVSPRFEPDPDADLVLVQSRGWAKWTRTTIGDITSYSRTVHHHRLGEAVFRARVYMGGPKYRLATFISGFDHQENPPAYFLAELPSSARNVTTVAEAYEALKPEAVRYAESIGREVRRQGDIFAIKTSYTTEQLEDQGAWIAGRHKLMGTNHQATLIAKVRGQWFASGALEHVPQFRRPDHARVALPNTSPSERTWWRIIKNTVPVTTRDQ